MTYRTMKQLKQHKTGAHGIRQKRNSGPGSYICDYCEKRIHRKNHMNRHFQRNCNVLKDLQRAKRKVYMGPRTKKVMAKRQQSKPVASISGVQRQGIQPQGIDRQPTNAQEVSKFCIDYGEPPRTPGREIEETFK